MMRRTVVVLWGIWLLGGCHSPDIPSADFMAERRMRWEQTREGYDRLLHQDWMREVDRKLADHEAKWHGEQKAKLRTELDAAIKKIIAEADDE